MYEILFSFAATRYFKKLKGQALKDAFREALTSLGSNPFAGKPKRGDLAGIYCLDLFYKGVNFEIAYQISETNKRVVVLLAGTRENFYEQLRQYMR